MKKPFCKRGHPRTPENLYNGKACKACVDVRSKAWWDAHPEQRLKSVRDWRNRNLTQERLRCRVKGWELKGIQMTVEDYTLKLAAQSYRCAICNRHQDEFPIAFAVDHNHQTGQTRGLVCSPCNTGVIALLENKADLIQRGKIYLQEWERANA